MFRVQRGDDGYDEAVETAERLAERASDLLGDNVRVRDYSGRGMYGREVIAFEADRSPDSIAHSHVEHPTAHHLYIGGMTLFGAGDSDTEKTVALRDALNHAISLLNERIAYLERNPTDGDH